MTLKSDKGKRKLNKKRAVIAIGASLALFAAIIVAGYQLINTMNSPLSFCSKNGHASKLIDHYACLSNEEIASLNQSGSADKKVAFLTFDDGPSSNTSAILKILNEYGVRGNFFLIGNNINDYEKEVKAINNQGSKVFVHTTSHQYEKIYASEDSFRNDVMTTYNKIKSLGIDAPYMFRFPGGSNTGYIDSSKFSAYQKIIHENGMEYVDWNVDSGDASGKSPDASQIVANIKEQLKNKNYANILMHDAGSKSTTVEALPGIISLLKENDFQICILPRGLAIPQFQ